MARFAVTFGAQYQDELHPVLGKDYDLPDGWMTITAETEAEAREWLRDNLSSAYSRIIDEDSFLATASPEYYPLGNRGDIRQRVEEATPNVDKWGVVFDDATAIQLFLEWLNYAGYDLTHPTGWTGSHRDLLHKYYGIDASSLEAERHKILKRLEIGR